MPSRCSFFCAQRGAGVSLNTLSKFWRGYPDPAVGYRAGRNLNHLWATRAVVLLWDSEIVEWYYPALEAGRTHLALNRSTCRVESQLEVERQD